MLFLAQSLLQQDRPLFPDAPTDKPPEGNLLRGIDKCSDDAFNIGDAQGEEGPTD